MSEKTEEPTDKKVRDAREKGQVGVSQDITKLISTIVLLSTLFAMQDSLMSKGKEIISFSILKTNTEFSQAAGEVVTKLGNMLLGTVLTICAIAFFIKIIGTWIQTGPMFTPKAIKFDLAKLNPLATLKNMFSGKKLYEFGNNIFKFIVVGLLFYYLTKAQLGTLFLLPTGDLEMFWQSSAALIRNIIVISLSILLVFSVFDFTMQKFFHKKSLKMTIDEVKREYKNSEGDPQTKGQRNMVMHEILNSDPEETRQLVEEADAVVVNPTHYAVALFYRPGETPLPKILCKGVDAQAKKIIGYAKEFDKPVIRYVWLARTLYAHKGKYIPRQTLEAVAEIYRVLKPIVDDDDVLDDSIHENEQQDKEQLLEAIKNEQLLAQRERAKVLMREKQTPTEH